MELSKVYDLGADALAPLFAMQFDPSFKFFADLGLTNDDLVFRTTRFTVPGDTTTTYDVNFMAHVFQKPSAKVGQTKEVTLSFRIDGNFKVYQAFFNWKNACMNSYDGLVGDISDPDLTTAFEAYPIQSDGTPKTGINKFSFEKVWCKTVPDIPFDYSSGEPLILDFTLVFLRMKNNVAQGDEYSFRPSKLA